jgi:Tfp pilus assembly protein PilF
MLKNLLGFGLTLGVVLGYSVNFSYAQEEPTCFMVTETGQRVNLSNVCSRKVPDTQMSWSSNQQLMQTIAKGRALEGEGKLSEAEAEFRRAISLEPTYPDAYDALGNVLGSQGRKNEAIAMYRKAIQLRPKGSKLNARTYNGLGLALLETGDVKEGIKCLCRSTNLDPNLSKPRQDLVERLPRLRMGVPSMRQEDVTQFCENYQENQRVPSQAQRIRYR